LNQTGSTAHDKPPVIDHRALRASGVSVYKHFNYFPRCLSPAETLVTYTEQGHICEGSVRQHDTELFAMASGKFLMLTTIACCKRKKLLK